MKMNIRHKINYISGVATELELIDYDITLLSVMAKTILENSYTHIDIAMETLPTNGARPIVTPLFPMQPNPTPQNIINPEEDKPEPVGYQRYYRLDDLDKKEGSLNIMLELSTSVTLAMITTAIDRLKKRKAVLLRTSKGIIKID
jgi:hypothetical protein